MDDDYVTAGDALATSAPRHGGTLCTAMAAEEAGMFLGLRYSCAAHPQAGAVADVLAANEGWGPLAALAPPASGAHSSGAPFAVPRGAWSAPLGGDEARAELAVEALLQRCSQPG